MGELGMSDESPMGVHPRCAATSRRSRTRWTQMAARAAERPSRRRHHPACRRRCSGWAAARRARRGRTRRPPVSASSRSRPPRQPRPTSVTAWKRMGADVGAPTLVPAETSARTDVASALAGGPATPGPTGPSLVLAEDGRSISRSRHRGAAARRHRRPVGPGQPAGGQPGRSTGGAWTRRAGWWPGPTPPGRGGDRALAHHPAGPGPCSTCCPARAGRWSRRSTTLRSVPAPSPDARCWWWPRGLPG